VEKENKGEEATDRPNSSGKWPFKGDRERQTQMNGIQSRGERLLHGVSKMSLHCLAITLTYVNQFG